MKCSRQPFRRLRDHAVVWGSLVIPGLDELLDLEDLAPSSLRVNADGEMSRWRWRIRIVVSRVVILAGAAWAAAAMFGVSILEAATMGLFVGWLTVILLHESRLRRPPRSGGPSGPHRPRGGDGGAPVFAKLPPGPRTPLVGAAAKSLPDRD